ncbi:MAG TPA: hypothetical protein VIJ20_05105, partial [Solirubrobacteraceae bacterium]
MRALLSYESFAGFAGTETYILTVARELERRGHEASVYTPNPGPIADQAREQGLRIIGRGELPADCDVLLCSDAATCYELMELVGCPVRMFIAHSVDYALQYAPQLRQAGGAVVVMNDRVGRWVKSQARHPPVARLRQPIDLGRFLDLGAPRARARRVLVSSNYLDGARVQLIERACRACGLELDSIGAKSRMTSTPERALAEADIVIGLGRTALEAMAAGRAVYVYGQVGADGWVTPESYPRMEADGFAGMATGKALDGETLAAELRAWSPEMGEANRDLACAHHGARAHVTELLELAQRIGSDGDCAAAAVPDGWALAHELARLVRLEWQARTRAATAVREASHFRAERERLEAELVSAGELERQLELSQGRVIDAERRLAEHLATRRWRL